MERLPSVCFVFAADWRIASAIRPREIGRRLLARGCAVHYVVPALPAGVEPDIPAGAGCTQAPNATMGQFVSAAREVIGRVRPDFVHMLNPSGKAYRLCRRRLDARIVADWEDWHVAFASSWLRKLVVRRIDGWFRQHADVVITASRWLQERFIALGRPDTRYIPYAVLPTDLPEAPSPFDEPNAVFMGSFNNQWDQGMVLEAAARLKQRGVEPAITMIGKGSRLDDWRRFAAERGLNRVRLTGYMETEAMLNHLRHAHVLLFPIQDRPANWARCPFKVFQYAQARRPILTCRVGEVTRFLGDKAIYVGDTVEAVADGIADVMSRPRMDDVDYGIEAETWTDRGDRFLEALLGARNRSS